MMKRGRAERIRAVARTQRLLSAVRFPLLLVYIVVVVLAAWRAEIRPAFLDEPAEAAERLLNRVGIYPGMAVFSPDLREPGRKLFFAGRCLQVLAENPDGPPERIYPEGACPTSKHRARVRAEELMLTRLLTWTNDSVAQRQQQGLVAVPDELTMPAAVLPSIAYHFDRRERQRNRPRRRLLMLYTHHMVHYDTGEKIVEPIVLFRFSVDGGPGNVLWYPTERQLESLWPAAVDR